MEQEEMKSKKKKVLMLNTNTKFHRNPNISGEKNTRMDRQNLPLCFHFMLFVKSKAKVVPVLK